MEILYLWVFYRGIEVSQLEHTIAQEDLLVMMSDGLYELNDDWLSMGTDY